MVTQDNFDQILDSLLDPVHTAGRCLQRALDPVHALIRYFSVLRQPFERVLDPIHATVRFVRPHGQPVEDAGYAVEPLIRGLFPFDGGRLCA